MKPRFPRPPYGILAVICLAMLVLAASLGTTGWVLDDIFQAGSSSHYIFWQLRVPRALVGFLAGAGLSAAGMAFQALFLNHLATPYTLGVSSGASCGAAVSIFMGGLPGVLFAPSITLGALVGAGLAMSVILVFGQTRLGKQRHAMLLAGVAVSFFFSSLLLFLQSISSNNESFQIIRWMMGGISVAGYQEVLVLVPVLLLGLLYLGLSWSGLNLLLLGDELAQARGLSVVRMKRRLFITVSVIVATIVSMTGPIGFLGMVIPHICRLIWGSDHKHLAPTSMLVGGTVLVACDLLARTLTPPAEIPVGVITSLIGAPFFFFLLVRKPILN